jgi:hypothetical protein
MALVTYRRIRELRIDILQAKHLQRHAFERAGIPNYPANIANWRISTEAAVAMTANSACASRIVRIAVVMCILR